jgi:uncharacterized protein YjbI with pentapeptide repeats
VYHHSSVKDHDFTNSPTTQPLIIDDVGYENCNFSGTYFTGELSSITFRDCNLQEAVFVRTTHLYTEFINCDLSAANFYFAELHATHFVNSPLDDTRLLHALVPRDFSLPIGYILDAEATSDADSLLDLVVYDPYWISTLPDATGCSPSTVTSLITEHHKITPRELFVLLSALNVAPTS